jgi:type I restriction enzyme M protein
MSAEFELQLFREDNLLKRFEGIHNYIYANDGLSTQQTLEEFVKILFIKICDERAKKNQIQISDDELRALNRASGAPAFEERIRIAFETTKKEFADVFEPDEKIRLSGLALGVTIDKLQSVSLLDSSSDVKGLAFQKFLAHQEKDGRGQFFTPEPVIDFCVQMVQPQPNETIIDPACGSGGFLMSALNYVRCNNPQADIERLIAKNLFGIDINKSVARLAKMKLLLESNGPVNILCANSLETPPAFADHTPSGFDVVLTNPPFGTMGKITNTKILAAYDLGYKWSGDANAYQMTSKLCNGQVAEILFVERCLQLLKEGGRMGIVLPNGHFENPSLDYVRHYLRQKAVILGVVNLPQETFIPFGTGVKTSLLFLRKQTEPSRSPYPIFFSRVQKLGYQGNKNATPIYKKDVYGTVVKRNHVPILDEDFSVVINDYAAFKREHHVQTEHSFSLLSDKLNGRLDYDFYSPATRTLLEKLNKKNAVRLADLADLVSERSKKLNHAEQQADYVELSDINTHAFEIINTTRYAVHELPSRASFDLRTGDILTAIAGNSVGTPKHATAFVTPEFDGAICTNGFRVLRNFKIDPYYLLFFLKSDDFLKQMFMYRTGAAIPNVSDTDLANVLVFVPDTETLNAISQTMKRAFDLRQESRKQMESIRI